MNTAIVNYTSQKSSIQIDSTMGKGQYEYKGDMLSVLPLFDFVSLDTIRYRVKVDKPNSQTIVSITPIGHSFDSEDTIELITSINNNSNDYDFNATITQSGFDYIIVISHAGKSYRFTWNKTSPSIKVINIGEKSYDIVTSFQADALNTLSIRIKPIWLHTYTDVIITERNGITNPFTDLKADIVYDVTTSLYQISIDNDKIEWQYASSYHTHEMTLLGHKGKLNVEKAYKYTLSEKPQLTVYFEYNGQQYHINSVTKIIQSNNIQKVDEVFQYLQLQLDFKYDVSNVECRVKNYGIVAASIVIPQGHASHTATIKVSGKEYSLYIYSADRKSSTVNRTKDYSAWLYAIEAGVVKTDKSMKISNIVYSGWPGQANSTVTTSSTRTSYTPPVTAPPPKTWSYIGKCLNADFYSTTDKKEWEVRVDNKAIINTKFKQNCVERFVVSEHNTKALSINQVCKILKLKNDFIFDIAVIEKNEAKRTAITTLANDKTSPHDEYFAKLAYAALEGLSPAQRRIVIQQLNQAEMAQRKKTAS